MTPVRMRSGLTEWFGRQRVKGGMYGQCEEVAKEKDRQAQVPQATQAYAVAA
jgi:hypothetical protein